MSDVSRFIDSRLADFQQVRVEGEQLVGEDFSGLPLQLWSVLGSRLERCRFNGVRGQFKFGGFSRMSEYVECSFDGAQLTGHNVGSARFVRCSFRGVHMSRMNFLHAELIDCTFTGSLREINFDASIIAEHQADVGRSSNRYQRNDFSDARLAWVAFKGGVNLLDQRLPSEDGYLLVEDAERVLPVALAEVLTWPESAEKKHVLVSLDIDVGNVMDGQRQVLFSPYDWASADGSQERAFAQLSELLISLGARNPGESRFRP